jgi:hypothetical protein
MGLFSTRGGEDKIVQNERFRMQKNSFLVCVKA